MPKSQPKSSTSAASPRVGLIALGSQLFAPSFLAGENIAAVFMREDVELCTYYKFHRQKLLFYLGAMRAYAEELRASGYQVTYQDLQVPKKSTEQAQDLEPFEAHVLAWARQEGLSELVAFEIEDEPFATRLTENLKQHGFALRILPSPMFVTSRAQFARYLQRVDKPFMASFYRSQRQRLQVLVEPGDKPRGGRWSFDADNRRPLPNDVPLPELPRPAKHPWTASLDALLAARFADHPGDVRPAWLPVTRAGAKRWLQVFLRERLVQFGPFEDALSERGDVLFHSVLTPFLNTGLLTPQEVLDKTLAFAHSHEVPLASLEGFVRQIIGWREFMRGIYQHYRHELGHNNFWKHHRKLSGKWYGANTGVPPLDQVLAKVLRLGYAHHIERLMVVGSLMLLLEVAPVHAHRWFMEMFVDSTDWVMAPNVYGMALMSDGGIFATKPYVCGSNYYRKMGHFAAGPWCDAVDGLYWRFVNRQRDFFRRNPRMGAMVSSYDRLAPERRQRIEAAADVLQNELTER